MTPLKKLFLAFLIACTITQTALPNTEENIKNISYFLNSLVAGASLFPKPLLDPNAPIKSILTASISLPIIGYLALYFNLLCHEGGHTLVYRLMMGEWPTHFQIGEKPFFTLAGGNIELGIIPYSGHIKPKTWPPKYAYQKALFFLAGPIAGILGALLLQKIKHLAQAYFQENELETLQNSFIKNQLSAFTSKKPKNYSDNYITGRSKIWEIITLIPKTLWSTIGPVGVGNILQLTPLGTDGPRAFEGVKLIFKQGTFWATVPA